jgi:hypothetical protein
MSKLIGSVRRVLAALHPVASPLVGNPAPEL